MSAIEIVLISLLVVVFFICVYYFILDDLKLKKFIKQLPNEPLGISETIALGKKCGFKIDEGDLQSLKRFYKKLLFSRDIEVIIYSNLLYSLLFDKECNVFDFDDPQYLKALVLYILKEEYPPSVNNLIRVIHRRRESDHSNFSGAKE
jgi:hypothetical protein